MKILNLYERWYPYIYIPKIKKYEDIVPINREENNQQEINETLNFGQIQNVALNDEEMNQLIIDFIDYLNINNPELCNKIINFNIEYINICYNITLNLNEYGTENDFITILNEFYNFSPFNIISFNGFYDQQ